MISLCRNLLALSLLLSSQAQAGLKVQGSGLVGVYEPGQTIVWTVTLENPKPEAVVGVTLEWKVESWSGPAGGGRQTLTMGPGHTAARIEYKPARLGWFELDLVIRLPDGTTTERSKAAFVVSDRVKSAGKHFHYGLSTHTASRTGSPYDREMELTRLLGVDIVRDEPFSWGRVEPEEKRWNFERADAYLADLDRLEINLEAILCYTAKWATTGDTTKPYNVWSRCAPRLDAFVDYVSTVAARYNGRVRYLEIWNEPDIGFWSSSTEKFTEMFNAASRAIAQASPEAKVINGGFAFGRTKPNPDFLEKFTEAADKTNWHIWAYHDYHTFAEMLAKDVMNKALYVKAGMKIPIWQNEGGFHSLHAGAERAQAVTLVKKLSTAPSLGLGAYFWYDLRDDGPDPNETEHHFGLTRYNFDPKPGYAAYQTVIRELGSAQYASSLTEGAVPSGVWGHLYRADAGAKGPRPACSHTLVTWREGASLKTPMWISAGEGSPILGVVDMMGNPIPVQSFPAGIVTTLTSEPVYIHVGGAAPRLSIKPLIETPALLTLVPGGSAKMKAMVHNPLDHSISVSFSASSELSGLSWALSPETVEIAAGGTREFSATAVIPIGLLEQENTTRLIKSGFAVKSDNGELAFHTEVPATVALIIPRNSVKPSSELPADRSLSLELSTRDHIYNLFSAQPDPELHWKGPDDLSATARMAYDDTYLHIDLRVKDDFHCQESTGEELWRGDGLQLILRLDETRTEFFEIGLAQTNKGKTGGWVFTKDRKARLPLGRLDSPVEKFVERIDGQTNYRLSLPWSELGLAGPPQQAFRFDFIVNDDDGRGRKQWVEITPGIGLEKKPDQYRVFLCR